MSNTDNDISKRGGLVDMGTLEKRAPQTNATCVSDFKWMDNSLQQTPCLVAAYAMGACLNGDWVVPAAPIDMFYTPPSVGPTSPTPASLCTCSWAAYNLISGCATCQERTGGFTTWATWVQGCPGSFRTNDTYYPEGITFPTGSRIPYWASYDPTKWSNGRFDATAARALANEAKPDLKQPADTEKKTVPLGAIIGGVVGGVAIIAIAAILAWFIIKSRRRSLVKSAHAQQADYLTGGGSYYGGGSTMGYEKSHGQTFSDSNSHIPGAPFNGYARVNTASPLSTTGAQVMVPGSAHTRHQLSPSNGSISYTIGSSTVVVPPLRPEGAIQPYTLDPLDTSSPAFPLDRKTGFGPGGVGVVYPVSYTSPNRPPDEHTMFGGGSSASGGDVSNQPASAARRMNPPAYDAMLQGSSGPAANTTNPGFAHVGNNAGGGIPSGDVILESTPMRPEKSPSATQQQSTTQGASPSSSAVPMAHYRGLSGDTQATGSGNRSVAAATGVPSGSLDSGSGSDSNGLAYGAAMPFGISAPGYVPARPGYSHFATNGFSSAGSVTGTSAPFSDDGATDIAGSSILGTNRADEVLEGIMDVHDGESDLVGGLGGDGGLSRVPTSGARTGTGTIATGMSGLMFTPGSTSAGGSGVARGAARQARGGGGIQIANPDGVYDD